VDHEVRRGRRVLLQAQAIGVAATFGFTRAILLRFPAPSSVNI